EPLAGPDQVVGVGRVDADVGLRVVLDQHRRGGGVAGTAALLVGVRAQVLASVGGTVAGGHAAEALGRPQVREVGDLGRVAARPLRGGVDVGDVVPEVALAVGAIRLGRPGRARRG